MKFLKKALRILYVFPYTIGVAFLALFLWMRKGDCITLFGYYGMSDTSPRRNLGDNAILTAMLRCFSSIDTRKLIYVFDKVGKYSSFGEEYYINCEGKTNLIKWLPIISKTDVFVMGGGGLQQAYSSIGTTLFFLSLNLLFWVAGRKIMWYSVGIGPLSTRLSMIFTAIAAKMADTITVRDNLSKELLIRIGVNEKKIYTTADPVFALGASQLPRIKGKNDKPITIGLSLIPFYKVSGLSTQKDKKTVEVYRDFIQVLVSRRFSVSLMTFTNTEDKTIFDEILKGTNWGGNLKIVGMGASVTEMLEQYTGLDYMVAMRFHSAVLGCVSGIPTGAVIYHPKVRALVREFELKKYSCELEDISLVKLKEILDNLIADRDILIEKTQEFVRKKRILIELNKKLLCELVKKKS